MSDRIKPMLLGPKEVKWTAPEFEYHHKDVGWYWLTVIASIVIIALALWQRNILFVVFTVIAEALVISWGRRYPKNMEFQLGVDGLEISPGKFYPYEDFLGFAVKSNKVVLKKKNRFSSYLKIIADEQKMPKIKIVLSHRLPEIEYEESLVDHLAKILRF